ncbi:hypothetical protein [Yersinia pekkanenii]|uniref:Uncharacterized protein n=1 Tax=Yersinia pekkanenii TaxID=1288385 RepID=A0A0T9PNL0_9GAMM|nr:hypothetical protein [Yersinia pekkanenii]CNH74196.1 Uncharacterised protein [Yersinia pekkanenii]CRY68021.1 Uncharacterised protein [Yersinia pekkanenii]
MHIQNIETADCNILRTEIYPDEVEIYFESVYDLEKKLHVNNICLVIKNWSHFEVKVYVSNGIDDIYEERKLSGNELEFFEYIQTISNDGNEMILQGYSKNSGSWLEYHFINSKIYLKEI